VTWAGYDNVVHSPTVTTTVNVGPILNSFTLNVSRGGTTVLTNADFNVSDPGFSSFTYSVFNLTGGPVNNATSHGQFELFQSGSWQAAPTGGFTSAEIAAGDVRFVQNGDDAAPTFTIHVSDPNNASPDIAPTVNFFEPSGSSTNMALVAQNSFGGAGEHQGAAVTFAGGHLYLSYNNGAQTQTTSDNADIVAFNTSFAGASQTFTYAWSHGDFFGIAADSTGIYAAGESYDLTTDGSGGKEAKSIFVSFDADGTAGSGPSPALGHTATNFYSYNGVEGFENIIATTQGGNTILYAFGFGQPNSFSGYVIGEYNSSGTLLATATDPGGVPGGSEIKGAADWQGAIWAVGNTQHGSETHGSPVVWTFSYNLGSVTAHEDNIGVAGSFNAVTTIGSGLYAVGFADVASGQSDYLVAKYNTDGSIAWSKTFGDGDGDTLNGAVSLNGHLYVIGSETASGITEGVLMEIDPSNGNVLSTTIYDPAQYNTFTSITSDGHHLYVAGVSGSSVSQDQAVLLTYDPDGVTVPNGGSLTVDGPSGETVAFATGSGTLHLDQPSAFTGVIAGISGNGDVLDMHGFHAATTTAATGNGSFNSATDTTTLTVQDSNGNLTETFKLAGNLSTSSWHVTDDGHGGVNIVDPPAFSQPIGTMIMHDPGQAPDQVTIGHEGSSELAPDSVASVTFDDATGHLILDDASSSQISVTGFTGDGTLAGSDQIDLKGIDYNSQTFAENYDATKGLLTVTDGNKSATLQFNGTYQVANFKFIGDGHGGTIVYDPPVANNLAGDQHAATAGGDCFAFNLPGLQPIIQHAFEEFQDVLAPLKDLLHIPAHPDAPAGTSAFGLQQPTAIGAAWTDTLKLLVPHTDLHV
jgi:hypothetical protein